MPLVSNPQVVFRGTTVFIAATFYDINGNIVQPPGAQLSLEFLPVSASGDTEVLIEMTAPVPPAVAWTAEWDSRNAAPGAVWGSVHNEGPIPYAVEDFSFMLSANAANLPTF
jgi:hypothetical protein